MSRIYEALKRAEQERAASQGRLSEPFSLTFISDCTGSVAARERLARVPARPRLASPISLPWLRRFMHSARFGFLIVLVAIPAFAKHPSAAPHLWKDPATQAYTRNGLPCSTPPIQDMAGMRSQGAGPLQQLEQIERQTASVFKGAPHASSRNIAYRPELRRSGQTTAINFAYHGPSASGSRGGAREGQSLARGR